MGAELKPLHIKNNPEHLSGAREFTEVSFDKIDSSESGGIESKGDEAEYEIWVKDMPQTISWYVLFSGKLSDIPVVQEDQVN